MPIVASIVSGLIANNLPKLADAVVEKGIDYVQEKLGVELQPEGKATEEDYAKLKELADKHDEFRMEVAAQVAIVESQELTKRLQADMSSDSWLSKNIRPMALVYILVAYLLLAILDGTVVDIADNFVELLGQWGMLAMSFYFGGRSVEKVFEIIGKRK